MGAVRQPMPDLLGRRDTDHGQWEVHDVPMEPGTAKTNIVLREMHVPTGDNEQERVVRAHEMAHAKFSPANEWPKWVARGMATPRALEVAEEFRVNVLCARAGFDVKNSLTDGSEKRTGERIAEDGDWATGVYMTAAFAGTARLNPFISGVRKHNPEWAKAYRTLGTRLNALARRVSTWDLGSTAVHADAGIAPFGFSYAEAWAMLLDRIANPPEVDEDEGAGREDPEGTEGGGTGVGGKGTDLRKRKALIDPDAIKKIQTPDKHGSAWWDYLRIQRCPMPRHAPGGLGKKRRPADRGRHPRRIHRILTDPQKRVFDATTRGNGGVVLIDGSGSMNFTEQDILRIVEHAPGATIAVYTSNGDKEVPNLFIVAENGRMVDKIPPGNIGNGVDGPAAEWAVKQRQRSSTPVVWVTDGGVHGPGQGYSDKLALDCIEKVHQHRIIVRPTVDAAVETLRLLKRGGKPGRWMPYRWRESWKATLGREYPPNQMRYPGAW